jgi:hypothetical protein
LARAFSRKGNRIARLYVTGETENSMEERTVAAGEIRMLLHAEHEYLYWIALLITGDPDIANKCLVESSGLSASRRGIYRDWLSRWARSATARLAAASVQGLITSSAARYASRGCEHAHHGLLSPREIEFIRQLDPKQIISHLDFFSRAILVMRGVQGFSVSDCALLLEVPRKCVVGAYCHALHWLSEKGRIRGPSRNSIDPLLEIFDVED